MNVVIDYGNSSAKVGIFDHQQLKEKRTFASAEDLQSFLNTNTFENFIVSSVNADAQSVSTWAHAKNKYILTHMLPLPISIGYKTPHTLGVDRIAAACGGVLLFPHSDRLTIDAGTCITYDVTDCTDTFLGGIISPGIQMRLNAMHTFTARLPLVKPLINPPLMGTDTESCMQSGAINGTIAEMDGIISLYREKYPALAVILCGGDMPFFENRLKATIFATPDLVLLGLNSILIHNVRN
jgi:type III pantothenate kinase